MQLLVDHYGEDSAVELYPEVLELTREFYESDAYKFTEGMSEAGDTAADRFRELHPEILEVAVQALRWCYTWDFK